jgi:hypothetical protein
MQEGDSSIEFRLGLFGAGDGKVNLAQRVAGVLHDVAAHFACGAPSRNQQQNGTKVEDQA